MRTLLILLAIALFTSCNKEETQSCWALINGSLEYVELDEAPKLLPNAQSSPEIALEDLNYPAEARENSIEGTVEIQYTITTSGVFTDAKVNIDIGGGCGQACLDALAQLDGLTLYEPGIYNGQAVEVYKILPINFKLE